MAWLNDSRMPRKQLEVSPVEMRVGLGVLVSVWPAEPSNETWGLAVVCGREGPGADRLQWRIRGKTRLIVGW